jgi:DNA polymerase-1
MKINDLLLKLKGGFCFDTETSGDVPGDALKIHSLSLVGISFAVSPGEAYYVPVPADHDQALVLLSRFIPVFSDPAIPKTGHNLKFDISVLRRYNIHLRGTLFDTMIAHYLCTPDGKHGLKHLSKILLNYQQIEITQLIGAGKYQQSMRDVSPREVADYACEDADQTLQLKKVLDPMLRKANLLDLFSFVECPLIYVLADMEYTGIKIDAVILKGISIEINAELITVQEKLDTISQTVGFNPKSPDQVRSYLFDKLGLESLLKTSSGKKSTSKTVLLKMQLLHPIVPLILKYKELSSLKSHFMGSLIAKIHPATGRVHTSFRQATVVTGRLSSSGPNLQNIPKTEGYGKEIRKAFVPRDEDHVIVAADYSQIELRVMAHFSKDPGLIEAFNNKIDVHLATASKIFKLPVDQIDKEGPHRKIAKTINFGLNYLMSAKTLAERISAATGEEVSVGKAKDYISRYFEEFRLVERYQQDAYFLAVEHGYSQTLFGRKRHVRGINSHIFSKRMAAKRIAVNTPIQGTAADIIKKAMVTLHEQLSVRGLNTKMVLQVHDELVFDVPRSEQDIVLPLIREIMENVVKLDVPLIVDIGVGENWLEAH